MSGPFFQGHDFAELAAHWGLSVEDDPDGNEKVEAIRTHLGAALSTDALGVATTLRAFLTALAAESEKIDYWSPVWAGLLRIEDDETLIKACITLMPHMWV